MTNACPSMRTARSLARNVTSADTLPGLVSPIASSPKAANSVSVVRVTARGATACGRPRPRPAPVTIATLPSRMTTFALPLFSMPRERRFLSLRPFPCQSATPAARLRGPPP